jgi:hypothetical protein
VFDEETALFHGRVQAGGRRFVADEQPAALIQIAYELEIQPMLPTDGRYRQGCTITSKLSAGVGGSK